MIAKKGAMPNTKLMYLGIFIAAFVSNVAYGMVYDNRFIPLFQRPQLVVDNSHSEFAVEWYMTTANNSLNNNQQNIGLPEIFGQFDQVQLADAIAATGKPNPLPSEFQVLTRLPWELSGKRQSQGIAFQWNQSLHEWVTMGFSWLFMRVNSRDEFRLNVNAIEPRVALKPGDAILLENTLHKMFQDIHVKDGNTAQLGFGDIDAYLRVGNRWDYTLKFRSIDVGFRMGGLFPTGVKRELNRPESIPFGGNGHWGIYSAVDGLFELKEDWKAGLLFRVNKRFPKTQLERMPVEKEPSIYGAVVGPARVNPGFTVIFAPYFLLENLRKGLILGVNFTLTWHQKDSWCDKRCDPTVPVMLAPVEQQSEWKSEYFTINVLYDFGKVKVHRDFSPIITFRWDIPSTLFIAGGINRAQRVSLGLDFLF